MTATQSSSEAPKRSGLLRTEISSVLSSRVALSEDSSTIDLSETLEKLAQRADLFMTLLDHEVTGPEDAINFRLARDLARALRTVLQATIVVPPSLTDQIPNSRSSGQIENSTPCPSEHPSLTPRQFEVLELLLEGMSNKQIARSLGLGEGTVKVHIAALFRALKVVNRSSAAAVGVRLFDTNSSFKKLAPNVA